MNIKIIAGKGLFFLSLQIFVLIGTQELTDVCSQPCPTCCHLQKSALYLAAIAELYSELYRWAIHWATYMGPYSQCMASLHKAKHVLYWKTHFFECWQLDILISAFKSLIKLLTNSTSFSGNWHPRHYSLMPFLHCRNLMYHGLKHFSVGCLYCNIFKAKGVFSKNIFSVFNTNLVHQTLAYMESTRSFSIRAIKLQNCPGATWIFCFLLKGNTKKVLLSKSCQYDTNNFFVKNSVWSFTQENEKVDLVLC